jgi:Fe-S oxidoreductase
MSFTFVERLVLIVLVLATVFVFLRDLRPKVRQILNGRSDRVRTDRLGARIATVIKEVVFQSRVVGGRPVAGALHAVVFLGFVFFALETTDHFLEPFGVPLLSAVLGPAEQAFKGFLAIVAVLVSIGIAGLAFRRFVLVKISPDPKSYSSGVVAAMILLLMLTYLNGIAAEPILEKANWWVHSLLILAFPPLILRSKHFHILMAPVDIFFRTPRLGDFVPLNLDLEMLAESEEEIPLGLETMADTPWKMRMDFLTCVECRRCTEQCPAWNCDQDLNPRGFILAGRTALDEEDAPVVGSVISETALGQCTTCGACEDICPVGIEHLQVLLGAKQAQALASGKGMVAADFLQSIERFGNPFGASAGSRAGLIESLGIPIFEQGTHEYLLWLGCVWTYNEDARSSLRAMIEVLDRAGVSYGVLESESCSGHHSRRQGEEMQFQTLATENMSGMKEAGVQKVVTGCPHCFHTIRREYPTLDREFSVETIHHSELLVELLRSGRLQPTTDGDGKSATFHDPCYLGRYEKVYDEPRQIVARAGFDLIELPRRRERSFCCGGGGGGFTRMAEEAKRVDQERKEEIAASGAEVLITGCPECKMMLDASVKETLDLVELVARATRPAEGDSALSAS